MRRVIFVLSVALWPEHYSEDFNGERPETIVSYNSALLSRPILVK
jgi:hypothetical protein